MSVIGSLNNEKQGFDTGNDSIVIIQVLQAVVGGRTLDTTGFTPETVQAGHVVIVETATGNHKPMPINGGATAYAALPAGHTVKGVVISSVDKKKPFVGIMEAGKVNEVASPFPLTTAIKEALPLIIFTKD